MNPFWRRRDEVQGEIEAHIAERTDELIESGVPSAEARLQARREFGNATLLTEASREVWGWLWLDRLFQDLRYAARMMRRSPGFTAVAVLSLALGIGANSTILTLIKSTLLRPIPVKNAAGLRLLTWRSRPGARLPASSRGASLMYGWLYDHPASDGTGVHAVFSAPFYLAAQRDNQVFDSFFAFQEMGRVTAVVDGDAETVNCFGVSGDFYRGMNVSPVIGRPIEEANEGGNLGSDVVLISYKYWVRRFAADPSVIGKTVILNQVPMRIIGVNPQYFTGVEPGTEFEIWTPLTLPGHSLAEASPKSPWWWVLMGRLKDGVSDEQATASLDAMFQHQINLDYPQIKGDEAPHLFVESGARGIDYLASAFGAPLRVVLALSGFILLIACANVANLLLSKSAIRRHEICLRLALGAGRPRVVRQLLTEGLLLAFIAGALGVIAGYWCRNAIPALLQTPWRPSPFDATLDTRAILVSMGITLVIGVLFSLAPALQARRIAVNDTLKEGCHATAGLSKLRLGRFLVVLQVALSVLLVAGSALCLRTFTVLRSMPIGFNPDHVLLFDLHPPAGHLSADRITMLYENVQQSLGTITGVRSATFSKFAMMSGWQWQTGRITLTGAPSEPPNDDYSIHHYVGSRFFETMEIPILSGRGIDEEGLKPVHSAVINQEFGRRFFQQENPIGRTFVDGGGGNATYQVVGVVADARLNDLRASVKPTFYSYWSLEPDVGFVSFEVKIDRDEALVLKQIRENIRAVEPTLAVSEVRTQAEQDMTRLSQERLLASLGTVFGVLAVILSCIGIYGVVAYTVATRTGEIGIRMALGAQPRRVLWMLLRETFLLVVGGLAAGISAVLVLGPILDRQHFLYELTARDPATLAAVALGLFLVGLASGYLPAHRATRIDPLTALRRD
jgi:predicted permease